MAENEILDLGSPRRYRRWRRALSDSSVEPGQVTELLLEEFIATLTNGLRKEPLHRILKACSVSQEALREVVSEFKNGALAKTVERAQVITASTDPHIVARKIAEILTDRLIDRANYQTFKHGKTMPPARARAIEQETITQLHACMPDIVRVLTASLRGEPIKRGAIVPRPRTDAHSIIGASLLSPNHLANA